MVSTHVHFAINNSEADQNVFHIYPLITDKWCMPGTTMVGPVSIRQLTEHVVCTAVSLNFD